MAFSKYFGKGPLRTAGVRKGWLPQKGVPRTLSDVILVYFEMGHCLGCATRLSEALAKRFGLRPSAAPPLRINDGRAMVEPTNRNYGDDLKICFFNI